MEGKNIFRSLEEEGGYRGALLSQPPFGVRHASALIYFQGSIHDRPQNGSNDKRSAAHYAN
jgi:hypothetical protein